MWWGGVTPPTHKHTFLIATPLHISMYQTFLKGPYPDIKCVWYYDYYHEKQIQILSHRNVFFHAFLIIWIIFHNNFSKNNFINELWILLHLMFNTRFPISTSIFPYISQKEHLYRSNMKNDPASAALINRKQKNE